MSRSELLQAATIAMLAVVAALQIVEISATRDAGIKTVSFNASDLAEITIPVKVVNEDPINVAVSNAIDPALTGPNGTPLAGKQTVEPLIVKIQSPYDPQ